MNRTSVARWPQAARLKDAQPVGVIGFAKRPGLDRLIVYVRDDVTVSIPRRLDDYRVRMVAIDRQGKQTSVDDL